MPEKTIYFAVEKVLDEPTGQWLDALVKKTLEDGKPDAVETWCTILDLDRLFDTCVQKWGRNWNLEKVLEAIKDSEIR